MVNSWTTASNNGVFLSTRKKNSVVVVKQKQGLEKFQKNSFKVFGQKEAEWHLVGPRGPTLPPPHVVARGPS